MEHLFLNYELSLLAREKGFDEPCIATYVEGILQFHPSGTYQNHLDWKGNVAGPLYSQIIDWFLKKHQISIEVEVDPGMYTKYNIVHHCFDKVLERKLKDNIFHRNFFVEDEYMKFGEVKYKVHEVAIEEAFKIIP